jgi:hypothetical protein
MQLAAAFLLKPQLAPSPVQQLSCSTALDTHLLNAHLHAFRLQPHSKLLQCALMLGVTPDADPKGCMCMLCTNDGTPGL